MFAYDFRGATTKIGSRMLSFRDVVQENNGKGMRTQMKDDPQLISTHTVKCRHRERGG